MRVRTLGALSAFAAAILVAAVGVTSQGAAQANEAPVPAPTHLPDRFCDIHPENERLCDALHGGGGDAVLYRCTAGSDLYAAVHDVYPNGIVEWEAKAYGSHFCPDNRDDWVRVTGVLEWSFNGEAFGPYVCGGFRACPTQSDLIFSTAPTAGYVAHVETMTATIDKAEGTAVNFDTYVWP